MYNQPQKSIEHQLLEMAARRTELSQTDQMNLRNLQKGYEGEQRFAKLAASILSANHIIKYSTTLARENRVHQIDSMLITQGNIYLLEIKNHYGNYYYFQDDFYLNHVDKRIANPFHQLQRSEDLLREFLKEHNFHHKIHPYVVFANPEFTLYETPRNLPVILPTQIKRFLEQQNRNSPSPNEHDSRLVKTLMKHHIPEFRHETIPIFEYERLRKGVFCLKCSGIMQLKGRKKLICPTCQKTETLASAIMRATIEFNLSFPEELITTSKIHHWCGGVVQVYPVRRILDTYMKRNGQTRSTYYTFYR